MKYRPSLRLLDIASDLLQQAAPLLFTDSHWDVIVPVPSSHVHLQKRLLHPCAELARGLSRSYSIPTIEALQRNRKRAPQAGLSHADRLKQLQKFFMVTDPKKISNKHVLIIEDVITTGATINAAALQLYRAGATRVDTLALARTRVWSRFRAKAYEAFSDTPDDIARTCISSSIPRQNQGVI